MIFNTWDAGTAIAMAIPMLHSIVHRGAALLPVAAITLFSPYALADEPKLEGLPEASADDESSRGEEAPAGAEEEAPVLVPHSPPLGESFTSGDIPEASPDAPRDESSEATPAVVKRPAVDFDRLPKSAPYYPDEPIPEGYHLVSRPNWVLAGTGIGVLSAAWLTSLAVAIELDSAPDGSGDPNFDDDYSPLFVPVAGPFIAIATADASGTGAGILALDGVLQLAAAAMAIGGLVSPVEQLEKRESIWQLMPTASREGGGLALKGAF